jgi:flagellar basal body rod protein FlgG
MLELRVTITGRTALDLQLALDEVTHSVANGNTVGFDSNEAGRYDFEVDGEDETEKAEITW